MEWSGMERRGEERRGVVCGREGWSGAEWSEGQNCRKRTSKWTSDAETLEIIHQKTRRGSCAAKTIENVHPNEHRTLKLWKTYTQMQDTPPGTGARIAPIPRITKAEPLDYVLSGKTHSEGLAMSRWSPIGHNSSKRPSINSDKASGSPHKKLRQDMSALLRSSVRVCLRRFQVVVTPACKKCGGRGGGVQREPQGKAVGGRNSHPDDSPALPKLRWVGGFGECVLVV